MILQIILGVLLILTSLCMIFVVLLQQPKKEGGNIRLGAAMQEMISVPQISGLLYKTTYAVFALLIILTFLFNTALVSYYSGLDSLEI
ncbi:MAG: preprotein translocase subunit SecG [Cytophagales bacterium]